MYLYNFLDRFIAIMLMLMMTIMLHLYNFLDRFIQSM